jgi:hypothetical protein
MAMTDCHLKNQTSNNRNVYNNVGSVCNGTNVNLNNSNNNLIGMMIGYQATMNQPILNTNSNAPVPTGRSYSNVSWAQSSRSLVQGNAASLHLIRQANREQMLPTPDLQSVSVLSVGSGQKEISSFHQELRERRNKNISFHPVDSSNTMMDNGSQNNENNFTNENDIEVIQMPDNDSFNFQEETNPPSVTIMNEELQIVRSFEGNLNISSNASCYDLLQPKSFIAYTKIYNVLNKAKVPLYCFDLIVKTIGQQIVSGKFDPSDPHYSRKRFLKEIYKQFPTAKPQIMPVHLDSRWNDSAHSNPRLARDTTEVILFDFKEQLIDLLSDNTLFGNLSNLVVNRDSNDPESKWKPYVRTGNKTYEVLDGDWYQKYAKHLVTDYQTQFCCPIGLYIDASETVVYQRYSFQPLIMFPLILSCKTRNRKTSSRVLALIPDLEAKSTAVKNASKQGGAHYKGLSIRNYHKCMEHALQSLKDCQKEGGITTFLRLGNDIRRLQIKVPVAFILGDGKSQDHLCGRYGGHNTQRMCRACNVNFENSDQPDFQCKWINHDMFHDKVLTVLNDGEELKCHKREAFKFLHENSQHAVINAFHDIDFAGFPRGIFGCTPHDLMHAFLEGVLKYCTRIFIKGFSTASQAEIDQCVDVLFGTFRSSEVPNMLRTNFTKGMTNLTMITADEEIGMALTLLIVAQTNIGQEIFDKRTETNVHDDADNRQVCSFQDFVEVIEILLSFHSWYKSTVPVPWNDASKSTLKESIVKMLNKVIVTLPRVEGNGWKIQKLHELLHIPEDVQNFGSPKNFDTGIMENRLIHVGKINAKTTQKRGPIIFTRQLADRIYQQQCFDKAKRCLNLDNDDEDSSISIVDSDDESNCSSEVSDLSEAVNQNTNEMSFCRKNPDYVVRILQSGIGTYKWMTATKNIVPDIICNSIGDFLATNNLKELEVHTEIKHLGMTFRAHPNYRSNGAWYDWAMIKYDLSDDDRRREEYNCHNNITSAYPVGHYPAKLLGFFHFNNEIHCIIHCCQSKKTSREDSCLTERWYLEYELNKKKRRKVMNQPHVYMESKAPIIRTCEVSCIADRVYVVEETPGLQMIQANDSELVVLVKKREMWVPYFTNL